MRVMQNPCRSGERVIALGTFDGVHRGHQALIRTARELADEKGVPLRVCTFNRHPLEILRPDNPPQLLSTLPEKAAALARLGVDETELIPFDRQTADMEPENFLEMLRSRMKVRAIVAGWNYSFGRNGRGNAEMLREDALRHGYRVAIQEPEKLADGTVISSSLVRQYLQEGRTEEVPELSGGFYTLTGTVKNGKHQGRQIGFPTANIEPWRRKMLPKYGVYLCTLETGNGILPALANIGLQPTIPSGHVTVEAYALLEIPDLYGQKVRLELRKMLREEQRFESPEALAEQIQRDRTAAAEYFHLA